MANRLSMTRLSVDLFAIQFSWTIWFIGISLFVQLIRIIIHSSVDSVYSAGHIASNVYMLVIGMIMISALTYYVENGITRKQYFYGNVLATLGLSIIIPIVFYVIGLVEQWIIPFVTSTTVNVGTLENIVVDVDGNLLGEIILSLIMTPFVSPTSNVFLSLGLFSLNIFVFYLVGWLIGVAFKRLGVIGGLLFIIIALSFVAMKDSMLRIQLDVPLFETFSFLHGVPKVFALPITCLVIVVTLMLIRLLTKRVAIKI